MARRCCGTVSVCGAKRERERGELQGICVEAAVNKGSTSYLMHTDYSIASLHSAAARAITGGTVVVKHLCQQRMRELCLRILPHALLLPSA